MRVASSHSLATAALLLWWTGLSAASPSLPPWQHPRWQQPDAPTQPESVPPGGNGSGLSVHTTSGLVTGFYNSSYSDVRQFLGIPFAQAPTGDLRFEPPRKLTDDDARVDATSAPPACPQVAPSNGSIFALSAPQFFNYQPWDEDCLALSIWAPKPAKGPKRKFPVIVWIHGMGLQQGSSSVPYQQPAPWVQRSQEHIVVAVQYRLNIFGFPNGAGLNRTNLGLLDQRLGLEWVRDNIEAFGGDPQQMVLWGQSSGAGAVDAQNFAFPNDPIVQGFISNSGSALFPPGSGLITTDPNHSNFSAVAKGLGCPSDPKDEASCMRSQSATDIVSFLTTYSSKKDMPPLNFAATPDEIIAFSNYTDRYAKGLLSDKPAIFGSNANEGVAQVPLPSNPTTMAPNQTLADEATLGFFQCPAYASAAGRSQAKRKTYLYRYAGNFTDLSPLFWEGAYHMSELPQIFGTARNGVAESGFEGETSHAMQDLWLGFAKDPQAAEDAGWAEYETGDLLLLGADDKAMQKTKISEFDKACASLSM